MSHKTLLMISAVGMAVELLTPCALSQQGVPSQPGTPSNQPGPKNPTPGPNTPNQQTPLQQPPANNPNTNPNNQPPANNNPGQQNPNQRPRYDDIEDGGAQNPTSGTAARYGRPFAFQSPEIESRFNESTQRLVRMEQRMERSSRDMLRRLGDVRQMNGDRQHAALMDLLQQMLQEQAELQHYLVQTRTAFTGEVDAPQDAQANAGDRQTGATGNGGNAGAAGQNQGNQPAPANTNPNSTPNNPGTSPNANPNQPVPQNPPR